MLISASEHVKISTELQCVFTHQVMVYIGLS